MKSVLAVLLIFAGCAACLAQPYPEARIWYFGDRAGANFNPAAPAALGNGTMNAPAGCAVMADTLGDLLYYSDGASVWNADRQVMPNGDGLNGDPKATQSCIFVRHPDAPTRCYLFTLDQTNGSNGLQYSVIDRTKDAGRGDVIEKNKPLRTGLCDKLTAVRHRNSRDVWVAVHGFGNNTFYLYRVTASGVTSTPLEQVIGASHDVQEATGQMKFSPDGSFIALGGRDREGPFMQAYQFDDGTGEIYGVQTARYDTTVYGLEFSAHSLSLYAGVVAKLYQYQIDFSSDTAMKHTEMVITPAGGAMGSFQLAVDGRIYIAVDGQTSLHVVRAPNESGTACAFTPNGFNLSGRRSKLGLPNLMQSYVLHCYAKAFSESLNEDWVCEWFAAPLRAWPVSGYKHGYQWQRNGKDLSDGKESNYRAFDPGVYRVVIRTPGNCRDTSAGFYIDFLPRPKIHFRTSPPNTDTTRSFLQDSLVYFINMTQNAVRYQWDFGDGSKRSTEEQTSHRFKKPGKYRVLLRAWSEGNCTNVDSLFVRVTDKFEPTNWIPSAFTPNDDGNNDFFSLNLLPYRGVELRIYDRWGQQVYYSNRQEDKGWDGKFGGTPVQEDTYIYIIRLKTGGGGEQVLRGAVEVIR